MVLDNWTTRFYLHQRHTASFVIIRHPKTSYCILFTITNSLHLHPEIIVWIRTKSCSLTSCHTDAYIKIIQRFLETRNEKKNKPLNTILKNIKEIEKGSNLHFLYVRIAVLDSYHPILCFVLLSLCFLHRCGPEAQLKITKTTAC